MVGVPCCGAGKPIVEARGDGALGGRDGERLVAYCHQQRTQGFGFEWTRADETLIRNHGESPDVHAVVDVFATHDLLGARIVRRTNEHAGLRAKAIRKFGQFAKPFRDAEIQELYDFVLAFADDKDVTRLEIPMGDSLLVCAVERAGKFLQEAISLSENSALHDANPRCLGTVITQSTILTDEIAK